MRKILLISLLCIPFITLNAQSKKELTLRIDSLSKAITIKDSVEKVNNIKIATLTQNLSKSSQDLKEMEAVTNTLKHSCAVLADTLKKKQVEQNLLNAEKEFAVNPIYDNLPSGYTMQDTSSSVKGDFDSDGTTDIAYYFEGKVDENGETKLESMIVVYLSSKYKIDKSYLKHILTTPYGVSGTILDYKNNELSINTSGNPSMGYWINETTTFKYLSEFNDLKLIRYKINEDDNNNGNGTETIMNFNDLTYKIVTYKYNINTNKRISSRIKSGFVKKTGLITFSNLDTDVDLSSYIIK